MANDRIEELRRNIVLAARRAYGRGIQTGNGGNVSARIPGEQLMLVKASGGSFADMEPEQLLVTDFDGNLMEGKGKPTREALLHGYLYRTRDNVDAVIHCHSPWSISWSLTGKHLENITYHTKLKLNCPCPTIRVESPMVRAEDFPLIDRMFEEFPDLAAFLLVQHGVVSVAGDILTAEHNAELVEETAQVAILSGILKKLDV